VPVLFDLPAGALRGGSLDELIPKGAAAADAALEAPPWIAVAPLAAMAAAAASTSERGGLTALREAARGAAGCGLALNGLTAEALGLLAPEALASANWLVLHWSPRLADGRAAAAALRRIDPARLVLDGCDGVEALEWGLGLGIARFGGPQVEAVLAALRRHACPAAARCSLAECAVCRARGCDRRGRPLRVRRPRPAGPRPAGRGRPGVMLEGQVGEAVPAAAVPSVALLPARAAETAVAACGGTDAGELAALVRATVAAGVERQALLVRLSALRRRPRHARLLRDAIAPLRRHARIRAFDRPNGDLVAVGARDAPQIAAVHAALCAMLDDPAEAARLVALHSLPVEAAAVLAAVESALGLSGAVAGEEAP
jgi:hypothetical protein